MYSRHRSPGNGYRSNNSMGMPPGPSPRISPENSLRGPGFYNNFNRGFGRGQPKFNQAPPPPLPPPRQGDIFMEAGRLAAEYLVSKGLLPPNALPPKWANASFKKQVGEIQEFMVQEGENMQISQEGRMSALARLGNGGPDVGSSRKRFPDEYNSSGFRNSIRDRRRMDSNRGQDWDRENSRSGPWSDKPRSSPNKEVNVDSIWEHREECHGGQDIASGVQNPQSIELASKNEDTGISESKFQLMDKIGSKESVPDSRETIPVEAEKTITKEPDEMKRINVMTEEVKAGNEVDESEKLNSSVDLYVDKGEMGADNHDTNLLSLCIHAKVPTRIRSSLACRGSKVDSLTIAEDEDDNISDFEPPIRPAVAIDNNEIVNEHPGTSDEKAQFVPSEKNLRESEPAHTIDPVKCTRSHSFPDKTLNYGQSSLQLVSFERCNSMDTTVKERAEKRSSCDMGMGEASKKLREWFPSTITEIDEYSNLSSFNEKELNVADKKDAPGKDVVMALNESISLDMSIEFADEKDLLPSSFKICDLNLMEGSEMNGNHDNNEHLIYPSISETRKEAASMDFELSINTDYKISVEHNMRATDIREVEIIDLDNDSGDEDKGFNTSELKTNSVYQGIENFPNHTQSQDDISDAQDGYGLMISELLGNDIPNCSSVPGDINPLQNEIGLHNTEEILSDDDPIYMSLGEIPISMPDI